MSRTRRDRLMLQRQRLAWSRPNAQHKAARQDLERISAQREQVAHSIRTIGQAYHFVDLQRGVRRHGQLIAADIQAQIDTVRTVAQPEGLSQTQPFPHTA